MAALTTTLAVAGLGLGAIGAGTQIYGAAAGGSAARQQAIAQQYQIQAQIDALRAQQEGQNALVDTQKTILDLNTQQTTLANQTNVAVIQQQQVAERLRQQQNDAARNLNTIKQQANIQLEDLNKRNDVLNEQNFKYTLQTLGNQRLQLGIQDQNLALGLDKNQLERQVASFNARREQIQAVRQGVAEAAFGLQGSVNRGAFSSSQRAGQQANATNKQNDAILASAFGLQGRNAALAISDQQIGLQRQSNQLDISNLDLKTQSTRLGEESRQLGVQARGIEFGVNQAQFATTDALAALQNQMFGINSNISNIYLNSYAQNTDLINQANAANKTLMDVNNATSNRVSDAQERVLLAGGMLSQANQSAANAATIGNIGSGIMSIGSMLTNNMGKINSLFGSSSPYSYSGNPTQIGSLY